MWNDTKVKVFPLSHFSYAIVFTYHMVPAISVKHLRTAWFFERFSSKKLNFGSVVLTAFSSILSSKHLDLSLEMNTLLHEAYAL